MAGIGERLRGVWRGNEAPDAPKVAFSRQDAARINQAFSRLDRGERRAILRAVNRGVAVERRKDAEIAVGVARRQQRFWKRAWLIGPFIAGVQALVTPIGVRDGIILAVWGTSVLGIMAAWWFKRARRAELLNLELVGRRRGGAGAKGSGRGTAASATSVSSSTGGRRRSRLPGGPSVADQEGRWPDAQDASGTDAEGTAARVEGSRPPRPRGRKRR
jgi:hypothetical protein